jgi:alkanesulfonate monooxygenase SsuD/methylene tetrahydromethanopterin reductase-like flavin-dependent oxidoreductase (luciferase family)
MTYAAACSERLRLGCAVFVSSLHSPLHLAKAITSLDCLSHGRAEVGLVAGGPGRPFTAFGVDPSTALARFNESLELMKACWTQSEITFEGRFWQLQGATMTPKPVQKPHPPIWLGGNHPAAVRRAVHRANGFFGAGSQRTEQFAQQVQIAREELSSEGRDPASFRIAKRVYVHVEEDRDRARELIEAALTRHYGFSGLGPVAVAGPPAECVAGLREVVAAGAELVQLNPMVDEAHQLERLAAEVIPELS